MNVTKSERFEQLDRLLTEHDGMLQTAQVIASGIVKPIFYEYVKEKNLQQVAHGIYVSEDTWIDAMFLLHLRSAPQPEQHGDTDFSRSAKNVCQKKGQGSADFDAVCRYVPG